MSIDENEVELIGPGSEGTYRTPPDLRVVTLHLPTKRLRKAFHALADEDADMDALLGETRLINLSNQIFQRLSLLGIANLFLASTLLKRCTARETRGHP